MMLAHSKRALQIADRGNIGPLSELIARAVLDNVYRFVLPAMATDTALVPLAALADDRSTESALRVAARRGRLKAVKDNDGVWQSTQQWRDDYRDSRYRRG